MAKSNWPTTSKQSRGYGKAWEKIRLQVLRRDCGLCQCEYCKGGKIRLRVANEVDHIVSKAKARKLGWTEEQIESPTNLQAINKDCHKRKTQEEQGKTRRPRIGMDGYPID